MIDLSYPSNADTFALENVKTPFITVKNPNKIFNVFEEKNWLDSHNFNLTLKNPSTWGEIIPNAAIRKLKS